MRLGKRVFDLLLTVPGLLLLCPVFAVVAFAVWLGDRGPVFFRQERVGWRGVPFRMWKFRTMRVDAERMGPQLTVGRDPRITRVGAWLRRTKVDELPQLLNVLTGEMSLVGPRPEVERYVELYTEDQARVLELVPGITDPASIAFRDESEVLALEADPERAYVERIMPEKIRLNLAYAERSSVLTDLVVILRTAIPGLDRKPTPPPAG
jgi:lipopolysaccharide/colanic/teichoic acid biosynthesis glycosyltransferase